MKTAKVTQVQHRSHANRDRYLPDGCRVFVKSNATEVTDNWFWENKVHALDFKCKTWSRLSSIATKATIASLREIFGPDAEIKWSRKAGCSCGCSPGYCVTKLERGSAYANKNIWADVEVNVDPIVNALPIFTQKLAAEIKSRP